MSQLLSDAELAEDRRETETNMPSRCRVWRKTGTQVVIDRLKVDAYDLVHEDLPFRLAGTVTSSGRGGGVTIGGVTFSEATAVGHLPALTRDLRDDDLVEITAGDWSGDMWRIVKAVRLDRATARRVPMYEIDRPDGVPS